MPRPVAQYTYLGSIYHPAVGFLSGCTSIVAGFGAPIVLAAIALGHYMQAVLPGVDKTAAAVSAIVLLTLIHLVGVRFGCQLQNVFTVSKILLIIVFIIAGFFTAHPQQIVLRQAKEVETIFSPAFAVALVYVSYAYSGWNASAYVAGEVPKPERNIPISLFSGTLTRGSPVYAILLQSSVAVLLAVASAFNAILTFVGFTFWCKGPCLLQ